MEVVGKSVDYGYRAVLLEFFEVGLLESANHNRVYAIAFEHFHGVVNGLAASELNVIRGEKERGAAELAHALFERNSRPRRRLRENERNRLAFEIVLLFASAVHVFEFYGAGKHFVNIAHGIILKRQKVLVVYFSLRLVLR